jgi:DNA polymerase-1
MRQAGKAYTFSPLYGGMGMSEPEHVQEYFKTYFTIYAGLKDWHRQLMDGVLKDGIVRTPSGREFLFPNAKRLGNGRITNSTAVVNYPVQSFATGDCVPIACIRALKYFREHNLKSKLILTVHDSIVVDLLSEEKDKVVAGLQWAMEGVKDDLQRRFNYTPSLPLDIEIEAGKNWMEMQEIV